MNVDILNSLKILQKFTYQLFYNPFLWQKNIFSWHKREICGASTRQQIGV